MIPDAWRLKDSIVIPNRLIRILPRKGGTQKEKAQPKRQYSKKGILPAIGAGSPLIEMMLPVLSKFQKAILFEYTKNTALQMEIEKDKMLSQLKKEYYLIPIEGNELMLTIELAKFKMNGQKITFNKNALKNAK